MTRGGGGDDDCVALLPFLFSSGNYESKLDCEINLEIWSDIYSIGKGET